MGILDSIEKEQRREIKAKAREDKAVHIGRAAVIVFLVSPFAAANFMFIPFAGQVLVASAIILSVAYCITRRSFKLFITGLAASVISLIVTTALATRLGAHASPAAYSLMGLGAAIVIAYNISVIGAFWSLYDRAADRLGSGL